MFYLASSLTNHRTGHELSHLPILLAGILSHLPILLAVPLWPSRDFFWYILYIYSIYARTTMMPPWVLASGPKPCGGNKEMINHFFMIMIMSMTMTMLLFFIVGT